MIEQYNKKKHWLSVYDFIRTHKDSDFYITENNMRCVIDNEISLKKLIRSAKQIYLLAEKGDIQGILVLWVSLGNVPRTYIKLSTLNEDTADKLISVMLWNSEVEVFAKIKKYSKLLKVFRNKGFQWIGDRGQEVLLKHIAYRKINSNITKDKDEN